MSKPRTKGTLPDPRFRFDPAVVGAEELERSFFLRDTGAIAHSLLGVWLARRFEGAWYGGTIVETEAYLGVTDRAAHSWNGRRTPRVEPMYRDGGHLYVYLVYGMHHCANVVTRGEGVPEAVLLRALQAPPGAPHGLASGPGRLCRALGITVRHSGIDMVEGGEIRLFRGPKRSIEVGVSVRVGIDYAGEARDWPLRFFDRASPSVSGPRKLRRITNDERRMTRDQ